ncbi:MAG: molybdopterin-dependent oxidoreductase [Rhizobiaceae bacterium]
MQQEEAREVRTTCPYCGVGCGVLAKVAADGAVSVRGDPDHPANFGRLCSKGSALGETVDLDGRLLHPEIDGRKASWDEALDLVASRFSATVAQYGPDSVAFYVSGQLLTEDYYVANKLMKGFIGSANIDTNSRLCMASSVAGHRRAFGSDTVPGNYEDLELADLVVLVGSNLAWCHPVLYQRIAAAKEKRPQMKVVLVDPRRTNTADMADMHLRIAPDGDVALFSGLLAWLSDAGAFDRQYIDNHTTGFTDTLADARSWTVEAVAAQTGIARDDLIAFYSLFARTGRTVTVYSQGVNQSASGTDKVNAIINCHLATGRIGKPGASPFSVTGQPNAMGGREVGGLANMLAAHMEIENLDHRGLVAGFWNAPRVASQPGLKAVALFDAIAAGKVRAVWIMGTNPAVSMPDAGKVRSALAACPFVVVSDVMASTDTMPFAHVKLPAAAWGEKSGTVTNSERRISRQRSFLPLPGEARPDWDIISDVARRMGYRGAFDFASPTGIFAEHAALSGHENDGARDFDISAFAEVDDDGYERLQPFQWPLSRGENRGRERFFAEGGFYRPEGRARFVAPARSIDITGEDGALTFNTGRVRDHWHTLTRTGKSPRLSQHIAEPFLEIHPEDALKRGIHHADLVRVHNEFGSAVLRALVTSRQRPGSVFAPMHWNDEFAPTACVDRLVAPDVDPHSGQPALKQSKATVGRFPVKAYGFAVTREKPEIGDAAYWALARCKGGWRAELAYVEANADWRDYAAGLLGASSADDLLAFNDDAVGLRRFALFHDGQLTGALFLSPDPVAVSRSWAVEQLSADFADPRDRLGVIAGRPGKGRADHGAIICSCFQVGANQIAAAVRSGCQTVDAVGAAVSAGTNCGSCRAEIRTIIGDNRLAAAE